MISPTSIHTKKDLLAHLVEELSTAHEDTVRLATEPSTPLEWDVHLDYLRALQRLARESLAHTG